MLRGLAEDIARGRRAIALARERGMDTTAWETVLADLEHQSLLAWASRLAEQDLVLKQPVCFVEKPLIPVQVQEVSEYARRHLCAIASAQLNKKTGGWGRFNAAWWRKRGEEALGALQALHKAMDEQSMSEAKDD